jgi:hypothetical protein
VQDATAEGQEQPSVIDAVCTAAGLPGAAGGKNEEFLKLFAPEQEVEYWPLGSRELMASHTLVSDFPQSPLAKQHEEAP